MGHSGNEAHLDCLTLLQLARLLLVGSCKARGAAALLEGGGGGAGVAALVADGVDDGARTLD